MFSYETVRDEETLISLTSLRICEFVALCAVFGKHWNEFTKQSDKDPKKGGRPYALKTMEDRLLFILFYLKTYPLQKVIAYSFGISQGGANILIHQLSKVLKLTLQEGGFVPPRLANDLLEKLEEENRQDYGIDGTERRIVRPANPEVQRGFFSGKKNCHTVKNNLLVGLEDRQIKGLSGTHEGKKHDKKICDEENTRLPEGTDLYRDSGFQGHDMEGVNIHQPKKKPRGGQLTDEDKEGNRLISSVRVVVEHVISGVKRCRIVKDIFRNTLADFDDLVMELACALHNFRSYCRMAAY